MAVVLLRIHYFVQIVPMTESMWLSIEKRCIVCLCGADSRSHWALLHWSHSGHYRLAAAQAWLHACRLFTWTFCCVELARESADDAVSSAEPNAEHSEFDIAELCQWPWSHYWTHRRLPCPAFPSWHCTLRSCYNATVSWSWLSFSCCMFAVYIFCALTLLFSYQLGHL